jgi:hypothetical protein
MARHVFNFENGDILTTMGASWFVSYAYYLYVDREHINWEEVSTRQSRMSVFSNSKKHHRFFLMKISEMNEKNLDKNTLGLKGSKIKQMARELLTHIE